jgi:hypothetical protein
MLARKVVQQEKLGINQTVEHRQYLVMMPIILAALFSFAVIRYVTSVRDKQGKGEAS